MNVSSKRAEYISLIALAINVIFFVSAILIGVFSKAYGAYALAWQILGGGLVWFVLVVQFHQQNLAEREKLDMSRVEKSKDSGTIFQSEGGREALFAAAQKQLAVFEKWFIPIFGAIIALYFIGIGIFTYLRVQAIGPLLDKLQEPQLYAVFLVIIAFVSFLLSRYATGMSSERAWKPLRAGGSAFMATAIFSFALAISLALAQFKYYGLLTIVTWAIPVILIILGVEAVLNSIFDVYRPRIKGQYSRSAFDSRLLGAINEPGGILHTFASAIDYQFGFQVSQTWFYKLLSKAVLPLFLIGALVLYLLSCIVIVEPSQQALIEHFGSFDRIAGPGVAFKLPYPFDIAYKYDTGEIQQVDIGFSKESSEHTKEEIDSQALLWGEKHYAEEDYLLAATEDGVHYGKSEDGAIPVSIVLAAIPIQYRINDLKAYLYNHDDAREVLKTICYRELTRFAASSTIETDAESNQSILGSGRKAAGDILKARIQEAVKSANLGVEILFLGLQGVHPPPEVAKEYQKVIGSIQEKQALILAAQAERNRLLATLGGSVSKVTEIYDLAVKYQQAEESGNTEKADELSKELDKIFYSSGGQIYKELSEADSYAFERMALAKATGERFAGQIKAYRASPEIYKRLLRLNVLEDTLTKARKYVVIAGGDKKQIYIIDLQEKLAPSLYDIDLENME